MTTPNEFIRKVRTQKELTVPELAEKLKCSKRGLEDWLGDKRMCSKSIVYLACLVFDYNFEWWGKRIDWESEVDKKNRK